MTLVLVFTLFLGGCAWVDLVPEHATKDKTEYKADMRQCQKQVRDYYRDNTDRYNVSEEMIDIRSCLKDKGWIYFKKNE